MKRLEAGCDERLPQRHLGRVAQILAKADDADLIFRRVPTLGPVVVAGTFCIHLDEVEPIELPILGQVAIADLVQAQHLATVLADGCHAHGLFVLAAMLRVSLDQDACAHALLLAAEHVRVPLGAWA